MQNKQKLIVLFLKEHGASATTKIADAIQANYWIALRHLRDLLDDGVVVELPETRATYWKLSESAKIN